MNDAVGYLFVNISSLISFLSCGTYFYFYHTRPEIRRVYGAIYAYILLCFDLSMSLATLLPTPLYPSERTLCTFQGFLFQFLPISKSLWTAFISADLYWGIKNQDIYFSIKKGLAFVIIPGITFAALPLGFGFGGYKFSSFCGVADHAVGLFSCYLVIWIVQIWNIVMLRLFLREYERVNAGGTGANHMKRRLKIYPVFIILCYVPLTVIKIILYSGWEVYIGLFTFRLSGLANIILYGYTDEFKEALFSRKIRDVDRNSISLIAN